MRLVASQTGAHILGESRGEVVSDTRPAPDPVREAYLVTPTAVVWQSFGSLLSATAKGVGRAALAAMSRHPVTVWRPADSSARRRSSLSVGRRRTGWGAEALTAGVFLAARPLPSTPVFLARSVRFRRPHLRIR